MIDVKEKDVGKNVVYKHNSKKERGLIVQVSTTNDKIVYVRYGNKPYPEPTFTNDLHWGDK